MWQLGEAGEPGDVGPDEVVAAMVAGSRTSQMPATSTHGRWAAAAATRDATKASWAGPGASMLGA